MKSKKIGKIKVRRRGKDKGVENLEVELHIDIPGKSVGGIKSETMKKNKMREVRLVVSGLDAAFKPKSF